MELPVPVDSGWLRFVELVIVPVKELYDCSQKGFLQQEPVMPLKILWFQSNTALHQVYPRKLIRLF